MPHVRSDRYLSQHGEPQGGRAAEVRVVFDDMNTEHEIEEGDEGEKDNEERDGKRAEFVQGALQG